MEYFFRFSIWAGKTVTAFINLPSNLIRRHYDKNHENYPDIKYATVDDIANGWLIAWIMFWVCGGIFLLRILSL